jgi:hypothetical protein
MYDYEIMMDSLRKIREVIETIQKHGTSIKNETY